MPDMLAYDRARWGSHGSASLEVPGRAKDGSIRCVPWSREPKPRRSYSSFGTRPADPLNVRRSSNSTVSTGPSGASEALAFLANRGSAHRMRDEAAATALLRNLEA